MGDRLQFQENPYFLLRQENLEELFPEAKGQPRVGKRQTAVLLDAAREGGIWLQDKYGRKWRDHATPAIPHQYLSEDRQHWGDYYTVASLVRRGLLRWVLNSVEDVFAITDPVEQAALGQIGKKEIYGDKVNSWLIITREGWKALFKKIIRDGAITVDAPRQYIYRSDLYSFGQNMGVPGGAMYDMEFQAQYGK